MTFKKDFNLPLLNENCNISLLKNIVKNWAKYENDIGKKEDSEIEYNPKKSCEKYIANYNKVLKVKYHKSKKYENKIGRWFCDGGVGIQSLPRKIRATICKGLYIDLDFKNCHPVILKTLCDKKNIDCPYLTNYINNRDELLVKWSEDLGMTQDDAKQAFLKMLNGNKTKHDTDNWIDMINEFNIIHKTIASLEEYTDIYEEVNSQEKDNIFAKTTNRIVCKIENKCLVELYTILHANKMLYVDIDDVVYVICALIFDGLQIPDNPDNRIKTSPDHLKTYSNIIESKTGYLLEIKIKDFDECLNITDDLENEDIDDDNIIATDGDAYNVIMSKYGDKMLCCEGTKYIKDGNIWARATSDNNVIKKTLYKWVFKTPIKRQLKDDKYMYYNQDKTCINKCIDLLDNLGFKDDDNFIKRNQDASKTYLPFKNGVYSFKEKKLISYDDIHIQFTDYINRDFPTYDKDAYDELIKHIINPIYPNEEERAYIMYSYARIFAGHYEDKKWFVNKGSRNSGKGVITTLLQNAFKIFVGTFNSGVFITKKDQINDEEKQLMWCAAVRNCRLIISNEIDEKTTLNGALIKKLSSGGDTIKARVNYTNPFDFTPQFCMMFMCNDMKDPDPIDALENCVLFYGKSKFVDADKLIDGQPFLKLKNEKIKDMIQDTKMIDAFTLYILDHYADNMEMPESVKASCRVLIEDKPLSLEDIVLKLFRHSQSDKEKLLTEQIIKYITDYGYDNTINPKKLSETLNKCNIGVKPTTNIRVNGSQGKGYTNISYIPPPQRPNDDDDNDD